MARAEYTTVSLRLDLVDRVLPVAARDERSLASFVRLAIVHELERRQADDVDNEPAA